MLVKSMIMGRRNMPPREKVFYENGGLTKTITFNPDGSIALLTRVEGCSRVSGILLGREEQAGLVKALREEGR